MWLQTGLVNPTIELSSDNLTNPAGAAVGLVASETRPWPRVLWDFSLTRTSSEMQLCVGLMQITMDSEANMLPHSRLKRWKGFSSCSCWDVWQYHSPSKEQSTPLWHNIFFSFLFIHNLPDMPSIGEWSSSVMCYNPNVHKSLMHIKVFKSQKQHLPTTFC